MGVTDSKGDVIGSKTDMNGGGWNIPVYSALKAYGDSNPLPFHMPGHKLGNGIPRELLSEIEKLDLTEIPGTDNLHAPTGVIKEAQGLAAEAFGAVESFFLVNGSTVGLHAAIAAVCRRGQTLITGRDSHRAVINGMQICGVSPFYILPEYSQIFGIHTGFTPQTVEKALQDVPDAVGLLITRPNYYGVCSELTQIAEIVHKHNKILIVDEAHGAHLTFNSRLPESALACGADLCIQSAHKTLPAFTQGAYLHVGSDRIDRERIAHFLDLFQTTSPSYVIMAYLDIARELMQRFGRKRLDSLLDNIEACSSRFDLGAIELMNHSLVPGFDHDATRITANVSATGVTGYAAEKLLREKSNIQVEMSDLRNIVCIATVADDCGSVEKLFSAMSRLGEELAQQAAERPDEGIGGPAGLDSKSILMNDAKLADYRRLALPDLAMEPWEILESKIEKIPLTRAQGRISGAIISPYPPGIAIVCPGESFSPDIVRYLMDISRAGGVVNGIDEDGAVAVIR